MGKPREQGRYAALRHAVAGLRTVQLSILLAGVLLAWGPRAVALNPALDVSQYAHTAWKIRDGFSKGIIFAIAQTPDGYLWLGTEFGLLRFDGVKAVPWQPPPDQPFPSSSIRSLLASRDGTLWIGTSDGLASWKDGKLTQYAETAGQAVKALLEDREGMVWVGTYADPIGRLCAIRRGNIQCYGDDGSFGRGMFSLYEDSTGNLWAGTVTGLWRWKPGPPKLYRMSELVPDIIGLAEGENGVLLINMRGGLRQFVNGKIEPYPPLAGRTFPPGRLLRDRDGGLWIATQGQSLLHVHQERADVFAPSDGLSAESIDTVFEDREGNIWVATQNGLDRFRDFAVPTISVKQGLSNGYVMSILAASDKKVWLGTQDGLNRWSDSQVTVYRKRSGLPDDNVQSLFQDDSGRMWVSTPRGIAYLDNSRFLPVSGLPSAVTSITGDTAGNVWISDELQGLFHLVRRHVVEQIPWTNLGIRPSARALAADLSCGGLWLGSFAGGVTYFKDGQVRASYGVADGLGQGRVDDLQFGRDGTLWASTRGGLSRIKNGRIATLTSKNGLPCDTVHWMMEDDDHSVWLYMACGLVRIARPELDGWITDPQRMIRATVFDSSDGVRSSSQSSGKSPIVSKSADGKLWFANLDGVSVVNPSHLPFNKLPPPVHIEQINADHKTYWQNLTGDTASSKPGLPALVRDLTIDYTALSLVVPEKVGFRYKLEGWDRDWQDAGTRRQAFYTNLRPRQYRFRVMACNNSGVWNEAGDTLDFFVAPAYYQTTWFRLSCVAAFLALLWGLYQLRVRQLAREFNAGLEARVNERTRIARELHDSLLQGFQGLMFRLQAVRDLLPGRASEAMQALDIALERGDKAIAEGRDTVSDLREPIMGDGDIAQALTALGKELALQSGNGLVPCVRVLLEGKQRELNPMLRDEIYRIAREALRNAFLHARAQKIEAEITYSDSEFLLHVRDDGGGLDPAVANQGARAGHWGLPGMRERAKSFGGKLEVWSEHGAGTEIELSVPGAIAYGKSEPRRRFWLWRKKIGESDGQQS
jgi:signal transduction histidine kinase/ligand-binding sensor domain-containing protein